MFRSLSGKVFTRSRTQEWASFPDEEGPNSMLQLNRLSPQSTNYLYSGPAPPVVHSSPGMPKINRSRSGSEVLRKLERSFSLKSSSFRRRKSSTSQTEINRNKLGGSSEHWVSVHEGSGGSSCFLNHPGCSPLLGANRKAEDSLATFSHFGIKFKFFSIKFKV